MTSIAPQSSAASDAQAAARFLRPTADWVNEAFRVFLEQWSHLFLVAAFVIMSAALFYWISLLLRTSTLEKALTPTSTFEMYKQVHLARNDKEDSVPLRVMKQLHLLYEHPSRRQWEPWQMEDVAVRAGVRFGEQRYLTKLESVTLNVLPTGLLCTVLSLVSILPAIGRSQFPGLLAWKLLFTAVALGMYLFLGHVVVKRREHMLSVCGDAIKKFNEFKSIPGSSAP